jgi:hypothetical protein
MDWDNVKTIGKYELHKADILLVDGGTYAGAAIKWGTESPVSHVAMCLGYDEVVESLNNGPTTNQEANDPPKTQTMEAWLGNLSHALVLRHRSFTGSAAQDAVCNHARRFVNRSAYDWFTIGELSLRTTPMRMIGGVLTSKYYIDKAAWKVSKKLFGYPAADDNRFICSEFVVRMYDLAGYRIIDDACWVAPCDFITVGANNAPVSTDSHLTIVGKLK